MTKAQALNKFKLGNLSLTEIDVLYIVYNCLVQILVYTEQKKTRVR